MAQTEQHPRSGQRFRIKFSGDIEAIHDQIFQGKILRLDDWADRLEKSDLTPRQIEFLLNNYANRCLSVLEPSDEVPLLALNLDGLVYGTVTESIGKKIVKRVILRETELAEA